MRGINLDGLGGDGDDGVDDDDDLLELGNLR